MEISLKPDVQKLVDERVRSGRYSSPEALVEAAIIALDQFEQFGDFETGELDGLLAEGEQSIEQDGTLDGEDAFRMRAERRAERRKPPL